MWILELQNDSKMLNVSLRRPPFHTCSSNKDPLSHIYFLQWILSQFDSQQGVKLGVFFLFLDACTPANYKLKIPVFSHLN